MKTPSFQPYFDFYQNAFSSMNQLTNLGVETWTTLANQQFAYFQACLKALPDQQRIVSAAKEPKEFLNLQADIASQQQQLASDHLNQATKVILSTKEKMTAWYDEQFETLSGAMKDAAAVSLKKAA